jgi:hypothetical protein
MAWRSFVWAGVQGVDDVLILLGVFFLPSVAPVSQQDFLFMELKLSASSLSSKHLHLFFVFRGLHNLCHIQHVKKALLSSSRHK